MSYDILIEKWWREKSWNIKHSLVFTWGLTVEKRVEWQFLYSLLLRMPPVKMKLGNLCLVMSGGKLVDKFDWSIFENEKMRGSPQLFILPFFSTFLESNKVIQYFFEGRLTIEKYVCILHYILMSRSITWALVYRSDWSFGEGLYQYCQQFYRGIQKF